MGKRLSDNLSSLYIGAANRLKSHKARKRIIAYVESYDDISFWRSVFADFENDRYCFQVMLPSNQSLAKGKKSVLMNDLGSKLGQYMVACVDSDYDYLLQGVTATSREIIESPFVFQTYVYAIENYQCYAPGLHEACVLSTLNDRAMVDFEGFMKAYSEIAFPLFVWSIWFYRKRNLCEFSMMEFCSYVRLDSVSVHHPEKALQAMERRVSHKLSRLERAHPEALEEIEAMKVEFEQLGVLPSNTYLFIQGHHIMDSVVMRLLTPVCNSLRRQRELEIQELAEHSIQYQNELTSYERRLLGIDVVLRKHTNYKSCPQYKKLENDIRCLLKRLD